MALWPFGKKHQEEPASEPEHTPEEAGEAESEAELQADSGPFDGDSVNIEEFDFSDFSNGVLNLGSMKLPLPKTSQVQVEMGPQGPRMLHVVTPYGRITPVAFAAPTNGAQWEESAAELLEGMNGEGMGAQYREGAFGREVYGEAGPNAVRIMGIDGHRWMLRFTLASPKEKADELAAVAYELAARTFVYRGSEPMLAGTALPVALPNQLVDQLRQSMEQRAQQQREAEDAKLREAQRHDDEAIADAAQALREINSNGER